jgi:hypothetical protein
MELKVIRNAKSLEIPPVLLNLLRSLCWDCVLFFISLNLDRSTGKKSKKYLFKKPSFNDFIWGKATEKFTKRKNHSKKLVESLLERQKSTFLAFFNLS